MPQYARDLRREYDEGKMPEFELVRRVLNKARGESMKNKGEMLAPRGITALNKLSKMKGPQEPAIMNEIYQQAQIERSQTPSVGLYVWNDIGCDVIEKTYIHESVYY